MFFAKFAFVTTGVVQLLDLVVSVLAVGVIAGPARHLLAFDMVVFFEGGPAVVLRVVVVEA